MGASRNRVSVTFTKDYAESKKGDVLVVGRSIAHQLITVEKVAELTTEKKTNKKVQEPKED
jgi:hypothetical protein